jgi:maltodextrin utilization protein YvdJ
VQSKSVFVISLKVAESMIRGLFYFVARNQQTVFKLFFLKSKGGSEMSWICKFKESIDIMILIERSCNAGTLPTLI